MQSSAPKANFDNYLQNLPGEDRSFGGNQFAVELVPVGAWFKNLRVMLSQSDWKLISRYVKDRAGNSCEICSSEQRLEAHERWDFDQIAKVQKLKRLLCLCKRCHLGTHWGLACNLGLGNEIEKHIFAVTGWDKAQFKAHRLSRPLATTSEDWKVDASFLKELGFTLLDPAQHVAAKHRALDKQNHKSSIDLGTSGGRYDLSTQLRDGLVVFIPHSSMEIIGGDPISECGYYIAKHPNKLSAKTTQLSLKVYIDAHNNPVIINSEKEIETVLRDLITPKRLILKGDWLREGMREKYLKGGILFSV